MPEGDGTLRIGTRAGERHRARARQAPSVMGFFASNPDAGVHDMVAVIPSLT